MSKSKYKVHVRAKKTRIKIKGKDEKEFFRGHIFDNPDEDLIALARADKNNRVLRLEPNEQEEALLNKAMEGGKK